MFVWAEVKLLIVFRRRRAVAAGCNAALNWRTPFSGLIVRVQQRRFSCFALKGRSCKETGRFVLSASDRFSASADFHFSTKKKKKSIIQLCLATSGYAPPHNVNTITPQTMSVFTFYEWEGGSLRVCCYSGGKNTPDLVKKNVVTVGKMNIWDTPSTDH